ncbi:MAG: 4Fe-4S binding protein [Desulfosarcinaceae bacterium]
MPDVYSKLAEHLDNLPAGFPATESGVELRILKRLFTPEEAEVALGLTMIPEPAGAVAGRLSMDESELSALLASMAGKGLIYSMSKDGVALYMAAQFVVGIWEYHLNDLDEELIRDVNAYLPEIMHKRWLKSRTKQLRVIPVSREIAAGNTVMPYEVAEEIIRSQSKIVVADCICRKEHRMVGKGCDNPMEVCLTFGGGAYYYEKNGLGRAIDQEEALAILNLGREAGLVLQPGNSQKPVNICMCCGCCCQVLKNLKTLDQPALAVHSNYYARVDEEKCTACEACVDRCQMDAITMGDTATIDRRRCIGCGVCVSACPSEALSLKQKSGDDQYVPPKNTVETYIRMAQERGKL